MKALLIFSRADAAGAGVIVNLHTSSLKKKVMTLISQDRKKEAFDLMVSQAKVETYIPAGTRPRIKPKLTLVEDI